jgi:hypothetical protein
MRTSSYPGFAALALAAAALSGPLLASGPARASVEFNGATNIIYAGDVHDLAARVTFDVVAGSQLRVVLTNTSLADVMVPSQVLTGVFFSGAGAASSVSATLTSGSTVFYDPQGQPSGGVIGGEWGFGSGLSGAPNGATNAIMSTGAFSGVGQPTFPGSDLQSPTGLDGLQYGLLSAGDNTATGNGGISGSGGLIKNSATFILGNIAPTFTLSSITNVSFQYGTSMSEPRFNGTTTTTPTCPNGGTFPNCGQQQVATPEPMSLGLMGMGLIGLAGARMRRRRAQG